jgi:hypothetical protein
MPDDVESLPAWNFTRFVTSNLFLYPLGWFIGVLLFICIIQFFEPKETPKVNQPDYNIGTPSFDLMVLTDSQEMSLGSNQKAVVIGVEVMNLWLKNAINKEIISISSR